jgi:hypothetical protein
MSFEVLVFTYAFDASFSHLRIAVDMRVRKSASLDEENLDSQQNDSQKQQNKG